MTTDSAQYEVIVVGAGPAGSAAALCLARAGVRVLLVDKSDGSFEKVCGGGLLRGAQRQLMRLGMYEEVCANAVTPSAARISSPDGSTAELSLTALCTAAPSFIRVTRRYRLDSALLQAACSAGADYMPSTRVLRMVNEPRRARVTAVHNNREITLDGQLVIAADGAANSFSRRMGVARRSQSCPAVRAYIACDDNYPELVDFHFLSRCLPLYCWVFPVESGLCNVGLALPPGRNADMLEYLRHVLAQEPVLRDRLRHYELAGRVQGGILRTGLHPGDLVRDRLLAAGDAAALVSPLTGEGIKQALISGELAAQHALRALASGSFTRQALYPYSAKLAHAFLTRNRQLGALNALVSIPGAMNRMVKLLEKDRPTQTLLQKTLTSPHSWGAGSMFSLLSRIMTANLR